MTAHVLPLPNPEPETRAEAAFPDGDVDSLMPVFCMACGVELVDPDRASYCWQPACWLRGSYSEEE